MEKVFYLNYLNLQVNSNLIGNSIHNPYFFLIAKPIRIKIIVLFIYSFVMYCSSKCGIIRTRFDNSFKLNMICSKMNVIINTKFHKGTVVIYCSICIKDHQISSINSNINYSHTSVFKYYSNITNENKSSKRYNKVCNT